MKVPGPSSLVGSYWYDTQPDGRHRQQHLELLGSERLIVRLVPYAGHENHDMIEAILAANVFELARNRSVDDVVVVADDASLSVPTMLLQGYGVRVHLVRISSDDDAPALSFEPDSTSVWGPTVCATFLREGAHSPQPARTLPSTIDPQVQAMIAETTRGFARSLSEDERTAIRAATTTMRRIPPEHDSQLLFAVSAALSRALEPAEKVFMRRRFFEAIESAQAPATGSPLSPGRG